VIGLISDRRRKRRKEKENGLDGEGEVFGKEVVSRSRKSLPNLRILGNHW